MKYERLTVRFKNGEVEAKAWDGDILHRLAELEDKIESGLLKEFPCKVGDTVYEAIKGMPILEWEVESLSFNTVYPKGVLWVRRKTDHVAWQFWGEDFGNKIFATEEAAEAKLRELEGE